MAKCERRQVVLVTGASQGVGLALARILAAQDCYRLVLTARSSSLGRLREAGFSPGPSVWPLELDVADHESREHAIACVTDRWGGVDTLINNAGTMMRAVLEDATDSDHMRQFCVNYRGPMELIRLVLPGMRERHSGRIINVSSVGGMMAMPTMSVYSASKFALEGASEALYYEVRPWNVRVSLVQPGFINSDAIERIAYTDRSFFEHENESCPYHAHYHFMAAFITQLMHLTQATPESVARRIARLMQQNRPPLRTAGTFDALLFALLRRVLPCTLYHELLYRALPGISHWGSSPVPTHGRNALQSVAEEDSSAVSLTSQIREKPLGPTPKGTVRKAADKQATTDERPPRRRLS